MALLVGVQADIHECLGGLVSKELQQFFLMGRNACPSGMPTYQKNPHDPMRGAERHDQERHVSQVEKDLEQPCRQRRCGEIRDVYWPADLKDFPGKSVF